MPRAERAIPGARPASGIAYEIVMLGAKLLSVKTNPLEEKLRFLRAWVASPRGVGAIAPSSPALARAIAAQIDLSRAGPVLELGPGTGALTRGILARGIAPERLTVIEYDPRLAEMLAAQLPGINVINGDAFNLDHALGAPAQPFIAVVSGIPLLNFPPAKRRALVENALARARPGAPLIQFSYGLHSPLQPIPGIAAKRAAIVLRNLPPAHVWVYRRR
jgi:phosphatidylethanolamine/phosphatidyl-N-methylethanolamine N-methyltransferase